MNITLLSKYRAELMGIAALSIILGHTVYWEHFNYGVFTPFITLGYGGVDVFIWFWFIFFVKKECGYFCFLQKKII